MNPTTKALRSAPQAVASAPLMAGTERQTTSRSTVSRFSLSTLFSAEALALAGALAAITASGAANITMAHDMGSAHSPHLAAILSGAAIAATLLAASLPACAVAAIRHWQIARALACAVLWVAAVAFSVVAAIGAASTGRADLTGARVADASGYARNQSERTRLTDELAGTAHARPVGELHPLVEQRRAGLRGESCGPDASKSAARLCGEIAGLMAEAARSEERGRLVAAIAAVDVRLSNSAPKEADPQSAALSAYAQAAGLSATPEQIGPWLSLGTAMFLELAAALGLLAAGAGQGCPVARNHEAAAPSSAVSIVASEAVENKPERPKKQGPDSPAAVKAQAGIINLVRGADQPVKASVRGLAAMIGSSPATTHVALATLIGSGVLARAGDALVLAGKAA